MAIIVRLNVAEIERCERGIETSVTDELSGDVGGPTKGLGM